MATATETPPPAYSAEAPREPLSDKQVAEYMKQLEVCIKAEPAQCFLFASFLRQPGLYARVGTIRSYCVERRMSDSFNRCIPLIQTSF